MGASAPNFSVTGFQDSVVMNDRPNVAKGGRCAIDQGHEHRPQDDEHAHRRAEGHPAEDRISPPQLAEHHGPLGFGLTRTRGKVQRHVDHVWL